MDFKRWLADTVFGMTYEPPNASLRPALASPPTQMLGFVTRGQAPAAARAASSPSLAMVAEVPMQMGS
jgi:hypothetical protein